MERRHSAPLQRCAVEQLGQSGLFGAGGKRNGREHMIVLSMW